LPETEYGLKEISLMITGLSSRLQRVVSADFFRPLARPSAPVYVDCADRLIQEAGESGRLPHKEMLEILREVLLTHPAALLAEDEGCTLRDSRQRAGQFSQRLLLAGWLEDQTLGLHERWAVISPGLRPLIQMLRDLAEDDVAELRTFTDTLRGLCQTLEQPAVMDPLLRSAEEVRSTVTDVAQRLARGISQLHAVEKLVSSYERRQRETTTAAETLKLFYGEFSQGQHMVCYDALRRGGLLTRIESARLRLAEHRDDPLLRQRLAEGLSLHYDYELAEAHDRSVQVLSDLERDLAGLKHRAEAIDLRMAAFNRLSQQRYRYQTELRGRRPELVKKVCDALNQQHAGQRFSDFSEEPGDFQPRCPEVRFFYGSESLFKPRRTRQAVDLRFGQSARQLETEEDVLARWKERQRLALTPQRAAQLVQRLLAEPGSKGTEEIVLQDVDDLLDLLAVFAYDQAPVLAGKRVRWQVDGVRRHHGLEPDKILLDEMMGHRLERFCIQRV
jgi:Family of unknown function (DUF5716)